MRARPDYRGCAVYSIEGPFFFGAVDNFERALAQTHTAPHTLLIRLRRVPFMDITGLQSLEEAIEHLNKRGLPHYHLYTNAGQS